MMPHIMSHGLFQSIIVISFIILHIAGITNNNLFLLIFPLNTLYTVWIERNFSTYRDYIKLESLIVGIISIFVFIGGVNTRSLFLGILFLFCIKPAYIFSRSTNPRIKIYSLFTLLCYICPLFYIVMLKKQNDVSSEKEDTIISFFASINIIFSFFIIYCNITSDIGFGFPNVGVLYIGTFPMACILLSFFSMKKISLYSACKYGLLLAVPFFPWIVGLFLLWSILDSFRSNTVS